MKFPSKRQLHSEDLEPRTLLAADVMTLVDSSAVPANVDDNFPAYVAGDANRDGVFDQVDLMDVLQKGKYLTDEPADWSEGDWNGDRTFDQRDLVFAMQEGKYLSDETAMPARAAQQNWPDLISVPKGFEPEGIAQGKGQDFFVGAFSYSSFFGGRPDVSAQAGAIYKGNLRTGEGQILVEATGKPASGLSYDVRTDYLYVAVGHSDGFGEASWDQGVNVYDATSRDLIAEINFGNNLAINDVFVTDGAVYATDSLHPVLYKIPLEHDGKLTSPTAFETIDMPGFVMNPGSFGPNGLVGDFEGKELVVGNIDTGVLFKVDTESGDASPIEIQGDEEELPGADGLYLVGRTLYVMQNRAEKIAVIQLSDDLRQGTFVKNIVSGDFDVPTTITGFGNSLYAINSHFGDALSDPANVQSEVVRVHK